MENGTKSRGTHAIQNNVQIVFDLNFIWFFSLFFLFYVIIILECDT